MKFVKSKHRVTLP